MREGKIFWDPPPYPPPGSAPPGSPAAPLDSPDPIRASVEKWVKAGKMWVIFYIDSLFLGIFW